jgi:antitoxin component of RelBE/YafQ-DinJ toxin-antitoxin module
MAKTTRIYIRITETLKEKAERVAKEREITVSELITDFIKRLPSPKV